MPKMKNHSGSKKRFKKTKTGEIVAEHGYHRHLLTKKSPKRKRKLRKTFCLTKGDRKHILLALPYK